MNYIIPDVECSSFFPFLRFFLHLDRNWRVAAVFAPNKEGFW